MNRTQTAAASLVASLPALLLCALLVMVLLNYGVGHMMLQVLLFGTLAVSAPIALLPGLIFVFWGRQAAKAAAAEAGTGAVDTLSTGDDDGEGVAIDDGDIEISEVDDTEIAETVDFDTGSLPAEALDVEQDVPTDEVDDAILFDDEDEKK